MHVFDDAFRHRWLRTSLVRLNADDDDDDGDELWKSLPLWTIIASSSLIYLACARL